MRAMPFARLLFAILLLAATVMANDKVYVALWFDTEDYIDPISDDAALRIATDLTSQGVHATFKVVGEKARMLEQRHRTDVIQALSKHCIGYHSNWHSVHPTPAEYLRRLGYLEGADEFERREGPGVAEIRRIFGVTPACYGQPGNSWGPQANLALRRMGIPVYLDEGDPVGLDEQPFWYDGMLYVFNMGRNSFRAELDRGDEDPAAYKTFDAAVARLRAQGGGVISIYYHPTEFVHTEFWDAVNFARGAMPERSAWVLPKRRTPQEAERCFHVLHAFVAHMRQAPGVQFVTARDLPGLFATAAPSLPAPAIAEHLRKQIVFLKAGRSSVSPADMLVRLLGLPPQVVDGPTAEGATTFQRDTIPAWLFNRGKDDAAAFISRYHRLPNEVFFGAQTLSFADFAATLAGAASHPDGPVQVIHGQIGFDRYFSTDPRKSFDWVIHPEGFSAPELLALGRLQGWTLKPAVLP